METAVDPTQEKTGKCPVDHAGYTRQKTVLTEQPLDRPYEQTDDGTWHIRDYDLAKVILRSKETRQAGFKSEEVDRMPDNLKLKPPVLFQDGPEHTEQRREIARYFTPTATDSKYRRMMEQFSHQMIADLYEVGRIELSDLSMKLAVRVASQVVGLTDSLLPGMSDRLDKFFKAAENFSPEGITASPEEFADFLRTQLTMGKFFYLDVKPAIRKRKKNPKDDVISHLIDKGYKDAEILVECVTYGAAGMVTTREFIIVATWHLLESPELRARYVIAGEEERYEILNEILRVEPVVGVLYRRAAADLELEYGGKTFTIPEGDLIHLYITSINADESVVGEEPLSVCPERPLEKGAQLPVMSFGSGRHRCPGAFIAIQETDIFLRKLLGIEELRLVSEPVVSYKKLIEGYEVRNFIVAVD